MKKNETFYIYLAFLRVCLSIHIIKKYILYFPFINDLFSDKAFYGKEKDTILELLGINNSHALFVITLVLSLSLLMLFGVGRNFTIILLFISNDIIQRINPYLLNGGDNFLKFLLLYLVFANSFTRYTLFNHSLICKESSISMFVNKLSIFAIKFHLCIIYFISGIFKVNSDLWFHGVATYYILNLERFSGTILNKYLVQNGFFVTITTYLTVLWEIFFPALIWINKCKLTMLLIGFCIHLGIYVFMMIHDFEILFLMTYGIFISDTEWKYFFNKVITIYKYVSERLYS